MGLLAYCLMPNHFHLAFAASRRWRPLALDAMADDDPRPTIIEAPRPQQPRLAKPLQSVPDWRRRAPSSLWSATSSGTHSARRSWPGPKTGRGRAWGPDVNADVVPGLANEELLRRGDSTDFVNQPVTEAEAIRLAIRRGRPHRSKVSIRDTVKRLGLNSSSGSRGAQRRGNRLPQSP